MSRKRALRVLLVEDNPLDARSVVRALTGSDGAYTVTHAEDLLTALAHLETTQFDCVLLDLSLPDSEGLVPVDAMANDLPVVVLTGLDDPDVAIAAVERGAQDYLTKSTITPELIQRAIRYAVVRHASEVQLASATDLVTTLHDRERIARDLHDTVIQRLFAAGVGLQAGLTANDIDDLRRRAARTVDEIDDAITELREAIFGLSTSAENVSLAADISRIVETEIDVLGFAPRIMIGEFDPLPTETHSAIIAVVREGLANVARHAAATAVEIIVDQGEGELVVKVVDNGRGLARTAPQGEPAQGPTRTGRGLRNLKIRAQELGGRFSIGPALGGGSILEWAIPLPPLPRTPE